MAESKFNFEGEIGELSPRQLDCISRALNDRGFDEANITIKPLGNAGDNYVANVKRLTAEQNGLSFKMVMKVAPRIIPLRMMMNTREYFINEHVMYTEVLPILTELEKAAGIPPSERLRYAACYGTVVEDCDELILLEDLTDSEFTMLDRFKPLTDTDIKLVLKNFARFHSLSYALKYQKPETYNNLKKNLIDYFKLSFMQENNPIFEILENECMSLVSEQKYKKIIKGSTTRLPKLGKKLFAYDEQSRFSIIQQGDAWTNNLMFQLLEGKSISCCMIDYQLSRINSPVADLLYLILNCTDHETRSQHYPDWIDYYHSELEKSLDEFELKVNYVYPRDQLDADLKRHAKNTFSFSIVLAVVLCKGTDEAGELKNVMENSNEFDTDMEQFAKSSNMNDKTRSLFRSRVEGMLDTCIQFGLL